MEIGEMDSINSVLEEKLHRVITVTLESGEQIEGTLGAIGKHLIQLTRLSGREFYDAVVRTDKISAIRFRARES